MSQVPRIIIFSVLISSLALGACSPSQTGSIREQGGVRENGEGALSAIEVPASGKRVVVIGDSLAEGLGVAPEEAFPAILEKKLKERGKTVQVVNAGISGSRSSSALGRVRWVLKSKPDLLVLELGANDALQGGAVPELRKNLSDAIREAKQSNVAVLLVGMKAPPNLGEKYCREFDESFPLLAQQWGVPLVPFLLEGVAGDPALNQADMKHPNPRGHQIMAETVLKKLEPML